MLYRENIWLWHESSVVKFQVSCNEKLVTDVLHRKKGYFPFFGNLNLGLGTWILYLGS